MCVCVCVCVFLCLCVCVCVCSQTPKSSFSAAQLATAATEAAKQQGGKDKKKDPEVLGS